MIEKIYNMLNEGLQKKYKPKNFEDYVTLDDIDIRVEFGKYDFQFPLDKNILIISTTENQPLSELGVDVNIRANLTYLIDSELRNPRKEIRNFRRFITLMKRDRKLLRKYDFQYQNFSKNSIVNGESVDEELDDRLVVGSFVLVMQSLTLA